MITITENSKVVIEMKGTSRPDAHGFINRRVYPRTGRVLYPDDREYPFWYYSDESLFYMDEDRGTNVWKDGVQSNCNDYDKGKRCISYHSMKVRLSDRYIISFSIKVVNRTMQHYEC